MRKQGGNNGSFGGGQRAGNHREDPGGDARMESSWRARGLPKVGASGTRRVSPARVGAAATRWTMEVVVIQE